MRALNRAYDVLRTPASRRAYDRSRGLSPLEHAYDDMPSQASYAYESAYASEDARPRATNGAGTFVGIMCSVIAVALTGRLLLGGDSGWSFFLVMTVLFAALAGAALAFDANSPLARAANSWAHGEPHDMHEAGIDVNRSFSGAHVHDAAMPGMQGSDDEPSESDVSEEEFQVLVDEAVALLPERFRREMPNVHVRVVDEPDVETLRTAGVPEGHTLLGLFTGVPLTRQHAAGAMPEVITVYRGPITRLCGDDPDRIREQVQRVVVHEVAHHFGIDHDDMPEWVK